jgi:hypothetical protein
VLLIQWRHDLWDRPDLAEQLADIVLLKCVRAINALEAGVADAHDCLMDFLLDTRLPLLDEVVAYRPSAAGQPTDPRRLAAVAARQAHDRLDEIVGLHGLIEPDPELLAFLAQHGIDQPDAEALQSVVAEAGGTAANVSRASEVLELRMAAGLRGKAADAINADTLYRRWARVRRYMARCAVVTNWQEAARAHEAGKTLWPGKYWIPSDGPSLRD